MMATLGGRWTYEFRIPYKPSRLCAISPHSYAPISGSPAFSHRRKFTKNPLNVVTYHCSAKYFALQCYEVITVRNHRFTPN